MKFILLKVSFFPLTQAQSQSAEGARCSGDDAGFLIHSPGFESPSARCQLPANAGNPTGGLASSVFKLSKGQSTKL